MDLAVSSIGPRLALNSDSIEIEQLIIQNPELAQILSEVDEQQRIPLLLKVIRFGTETFQFFTTTAAAEKLKAVSLEITQDIGSKKKEIIDGVESIATRLTSESDDLSIAKLLQTWRMEFSQLLTNNFDEKNKDSIISKFDEAMRSIGKEQNSEMLKRLDFNLPDSAINLLQNNLQKYIKDEISAVSTNITSLHSLIVGEDRANEEKAKQANRGKVFEDLIFEMLQDIARTKKDIADNPGPTKRAGLDNNHEGDHTIQINPDETRGASVTFVIECKLRKTRLSDKALYEELEKGLSNRGAKVGFIITEPKTYEKIATDFFTEGPKGQAILEMDSEDPDFNSLRFAYLWARWASLREGNQNLDSNAVRDAVASIKMSLGTLRTAKSNNTQAQGFLDKNKGLLQSLEDSINSDLNGLEVLLDSTDNQGRVI